MNYIKVVNMTEAAARSRTGGVTDVIEFPASYINPTDIGTEAPANEDVNPHTPSGHDIYLPKMRKPQSFTWMYDSKESVRNYKALIRNSGAVLEMADEALSNYVPFLLPASSPYDGIILEWEAIDHDDKKYPLALKEVAEVINKRGGKCREDDLVNIVAARITPGFMDFAKKKGLDIEKNPELIGDLACEALDADVYDEDGYPTSTTLGHAFYDIYPFAQSAAEAVHGGRPVAHGNGEIVKQTGLKTTPLVAAGLIIGGAIAVAGTAYAYFHFPSNANSGGQGGGDSSISDYSTCAAKYGDLCGTDLDGDYVAFWIEKMKGTDPYNKFSFGQTEIGDFVRIFAYPEYLNSNNADKDVAFLNQISTAVPKNYNPRIGGMKIIETSNNDEFVPSYIEIAVTDPKIKYMAEKKDFVMPSASNHGKIFVDGSLISNGKIEKNMKAPTYFFAVDRSGLCTDVSAATASILDVLGYDYRVVNLRRTDGDTSSGFLGHSVVETVLDGNEYVMSWNDIVKKSEYYRENPQYSFDKIIYQRGDHSWQPI